MAISTFTELKASIASWLHRSDLTTVIPDFITLLESRINRTLRLRTMESDNSLTLTSGTRTVALPSGYVEPISLALIISGEAYDYLDYRLPNQLPIDVNSSSARRPRMYAINGTNIEFPNLSDETYAMTFRMVGTFTLSDASPTNWLLTNHPDIYLFGSLLEATSYLNNDKRIPLWQMKYDLAVSEVRNKENRARSKSSLVSDLPSTSGGYNIRSDS